MWSPGSRVGPIGRVRTHGSVAALLDGSGGAGLSSSRWPVVGWGAVTRPSAWRTSCQPPRGPRDDGPGTPRPDWPDRSGHRAASAADDEPHTRPTAPHSRETHNHHHEPPERSVGRSGRPGRPGRPPTAGSARPKRRGQQRHRRPQPHPHPSTPPGSRATGPSTPLGSRRTGRPSRLGSRTIGRSCLLGSGATGPRSVLGAWPPGPWSMLWPGSEWRWLLGWRVTSTRVTAPSQASRRHASGSSVLTAPASPLAGLGLQEPVDGDHPVQGGS
jgi:hypothetical protein